MKKVSIRSQKYYSTFTGDELELFVVELDGIHVDSFSYLEEARTFARGFSVALKVLGNHVIFDCTVPIELK